MKAIANNATEINESPAMTDLLALANPFAFLYIIFLYSAHICTLLVICDTHRRVWNNLLPYRIKILLLLSIEQGTANDAVNKSWIHRRCEEGIIHSIWTKMMHLSARVGRRMHFRKVFPSKLILHHRPLRLRIATRIAAMRMIATIQIIRLIPEEFSSTSSLEGTGSTASQCA